MTAGGPATGSGADLPTRLAVALDAARAAGELLLEHRRRVLTVATKSTETDPVSEADHASEALVMQRLGDRFPEDGLLGEEAEANREGTSGLRWVVDPLDGTVNYLYGLDAWAVSIACVEVATDEPVVGVVHHPAARESFVAVRGGGARRLAPGEGARDPGTALAVRTPDHTGRALVGTGFGYVPDQRAVEGRVVADLLPQVRDIRRAGAAALDLAWTAAGRLDGHGEYGLGPWDWLAGALLVTEAGGLVRTRRDRLAGEVLQGVFAGSAAVVDLLEAAFERHLDRPA